MGASDLALLLIGLSASGMIGLLLIVFFDPILRLVLAPITLFLYGEAPSLNKWLGKPPASR